MTRYCDLPLSERTIPEAIHCVFLSIENHYARTASTISDPLNATIGDIASLLVTLLFILIIVFWIIMKWAENADESPK